MSDCKSPPYRLLACDLDGTLMGDDTIINTRVRQALAAAQARGIHVTLATGRSFPSTLPFARSLDIALPLICYQGGLIKHPLTGERLYGATMERSLVLKVVEMARSGDGCCVENPQPAGKAVIPGWHILVYLEDDIFLQELRYPQRFYRDLLGTRLHRVDDLARAVSEHSYDPAKFVIVADENEADCIEAQLRARFDQRMVVVRSHGLFVEGNPLGVNKGAALRRLAEHLGVPQAQVMAIGDQGNDVPMIKWAGLGVAMASGSDLAQAAADWIAPPLSADGAAVAIERFLLAD